MEITLRIFCLLVGYLLGSFLTAECIARRLTGRSARDLGSGNPGMAKGGSGDVLAGMILSLLGQGLPPKQAVPAAVWLHGRAGDLAAEALGEYGMTPDDLLQQIPAAIRQTMAGPVD